MLEARAVTKLDEVTSANALWRRLRLDAKATPGARKYEISWTLPDVQAIAFKRVNLEI